MANTRHVIEFFLLTSTLLEIALSTVMGLYGLHRYLARERVLDTGLVRFALLSLLIHTRRDVTDHIRQPFGERMPVSEVLRVECRTTHVILAVLSDELTHGVMLISESLPFSV